MRLLARFFIFLGAVSLALPTQAAHIIGGELTYVALGGNNYRVSLELYRDCGGGGALFDDPVAIFVYEAFSGVLVAELLIPLPGFTNISPDLSDPCLVSPPIICVEKAEYIGTVNLPPVAGGYNLVYQRCCRNNSVLNLIDPGNTGSSYVAFVPDPGTTVNNSPRFNNFPPLVICREEPIFFDHSAVDPDGDNLVYELCRPFEGASPGCPQPGPMATGGCPTDPGIPPYGGVVYAPPYSALFPLDGSLSIDPVSGLLSGLPAEEGQYVVGICVKEFRGGVQIGTHYRDFQFNVVNCDKSIVAATTASVINCSDFTITFDNTSAGTVNFFWDFGVPGPGGTSSVKFPSFTFPDTGTFVVTLVAEPGNTCADTTTATVSIYPGADADFTINPACPGVPTTFDDQSIFGFGSVASWLWEFGDGARTHLPEPSRSYTEGGTYTVTLIATSSFGCVDSATKVVVIPHAPEVNLTAGLACLNEPVFFVDSSQIVGSTITDWIWDFGDGTTGTGNPIEHTFTETGFILVNLLVGAANGCFSDTTVELVLRPPVLAEILPGDTICEGDLFPLLAAGGFFYDWNPPLGLNNAGIFNPIAGPSATTDYIVDVSDGCTSDTAQVTVWVLPAPDTRAWPDTTILRGESVQLLATGGTGYAWFPPDYLDNPGIASPLATPDQSIWYTVFATGDNGCGRFDSVFVEVLPLCNGFVVPNAFTPNGDGRNDVFRVQRVGDDQLTSLAIFNRWGDQLFATGTPETGWDGTFKGKLQPLGVYLYVLQTTCDEQVLRKSGTVTLVR